MSAIRGLDEYCRAREDTLTVGTIIPRPKEQADEGSVNSQHVRQILADAYTSTNQCILDLNGVNGSPQLMANRLAEFSDEQQNQSGHSLRSSTRARRPRRRRYSTGQQVIRVARFAADGTHLNTSGTAKLQDAIWLLIESAA